ncbi:hypothetical protein Vau01_009020 [Virgisporangium aurantiacum]|uniref:Uncharacterized protein n=1 Tax=Virgisporangium aurantiacum TaxID=175570 RepID=A0A8J3YXD9_9ACTN|nr:hypothetical protein Vau01_009020 [Virgisporangium aurantiacum]
MSTPNAMVFAPAPQLTVTVERFGEHDELHVHPGGQGIWQAREDLTLRVCRGRARRGGTCTTGARARATRSPRTRGIR